MTSFSLATLKLLPFNLPNVSNEAFAIPKLSMEPVLVSGLGAFILPLRARLKLRMLSRSEKTWPACGAAMTIVPGLASGGGVGESDRNSGCMCDSLMCDSLTEAC